MKKVTTEKAPVAGQSNASGSSAGLTPRQQQNIISQALRAGAGGDLRSLNELSELLGRQRRGDLAGATDEGGAAAAAGVLTAVDEDGEGDEEADVPRDFEYFTDIEEDEDED